MDFRKEAQASRTKKLHQLTVKSPDEKVDSSSFKPYADPDMGKKTGKRPVNPRNYKRGGKVAALDGAKAAKRGDRMGAKGRKAKMLGGDLTAAGNPEIPSSKGQTSLLRKAVGLDYKKGGRAKKAYGGRGVGERTQLEESRRAAVKAGEDYGNDSRVSEDDLRKATRDFEQKKTETGYKKGGRAKKEDGGPMMAGPVQTLMKRKTPLNNPAAKAPAVMPMRAPAPNAMAMQNANANAAFKRKAGGKIRKAGGGGMRSESVEYERARRDLRKNPPVSIASDVAGYFDDAKASDNATRDAMREGIKDKMRAAGPYMKGGKVKHDDEAMDKALIKKMVKPSARTKKFGGGGLSTLPAQAMANANPHAAFNQASIMPVSGPSMARGMRAAGGRTKGKSNINIVIAPQSAQPQMPPMMPKPMMPPPAPAPAAGAMPPGGMPPGAMGGAMPMPVPVPMGGGAPAPAPQGAGVPGIPGMAPLPRKTGGRVKSYKDMKAGAGSGEGRMEKEEMAEFKRTARKAGGKIPMSAGAGSGAGRIEKIHAYGENPHGNAAPKPQKRGIK